MRLFQVLEGGDFREVVSEHAREDGGMSGVYEAVALARQLGEKGTFVADYGDGQVLHFQVENDSAYGVRSENIRNLPIEKTPARITDIQAGKVQPQAEDQLSNFGAMYHAVKEEDIGGANAIEEL